MEKNEYGIPETVTPPVTPPARPTTTGDDIAVRDAAYFGAGDTRLAGSPLAMVYTPPQSFVMLYTPEQALAHGTLFEELYMPLDGWEVGK